MIIHKSISKKITLLNQTALKVMTEEDNISIIKIFTNESIKIFEADLGFAWGKFKLNDTYKIVYKSPGIPFEPVFPFKRKSYPSNISKHLKSYLIININYFDHSYGSIILGYNQKHDFKPEELALANTTGNVIAHAITINWLLEKEQKAVTLAEKQKTTEVLFSQEKLKNEFIANATHEIRTPLAIIKGNIDLALNTKKGKAYSNQNFLTAIDEEIKHLSDIVSDLVLITSRGKQEQAHRITYNKVNLKSLIERVVKRCRTLAIDKSISIVTKNIPNIKISGNEDYLEKMLMNLIKNSITYGNKNGRTEIGVKKSGKFVTINIADNGIGLSKEDLPHVFERFYRGDKAHSSRGTKENSTGLGLAIVKWVAEIHDGKVKVKSIKNKGSVFSVFLPIKREA